jgi:hypothetical protein
MGAVLTNSCLLPKNGDDVATSLARIISLVSGAMRQWF